MIEKLGGLSEAKDFAREAHKGQKRKNTNEDYIIHPLAVAEIAKEYIADFITEIKQILSQMPVYSWAIIAALAVIFIAAGFFKWRLTSAFCCATLGVMLIFAGMILLLLYKGAAPISRICRNQSFYLGIFAAMTAFGTTEQLLFCQRIEGKSTRKKKTNKDREELKKTSSAWRNR